MSVRLVDGDIHFEVRPLLENSAECASVENKVTEYFAADPAPARLFVYGDCGKKIAALDMMQMPPIQRRDCVKLCVRLFSDV